MESKRCYGCMQIMGEGVFCDQCGYDQRTANAPHQLPAGTVLREQYLVGKVLGQGGFGITYLGWDLNLDIPIAIKEYYPNGVVSRENTLSNQVTVVTSADDTRYEQNRARFLREAQTLAKLESVPEVVLIRNYFSENNTAYIIMGYVQGITLQEYIGRRGGRLSAEETFQLLRPIMEAMDRVHAIGLVHRDISPDNIMIQTGGKPRLIDFGAAHEATYGTAVKSTQAVLKYGYAPMEQYQRKGNLGPWTDVYAICATVYYCLTGEQPPHATDRMMGEEDFNWEIPGLTAAQIAALKQGTQLQYKERTQSMQELCAALFSEAPAQAEAAKAPEAGTIPLKKEPAPKAYTVPLAPAPGPIAAQAPYTAPVERSPAVENPTQVPDKKPKKGFGGKWIAIVAAVVALAVLGVLVLGLQNRETGPSLKDRDNEPSASSNKDKDSEGEQAFPWSQETEAEMDEPEVDLPAQTDKDDNDPDRIPDEMVSADGNYEIAYIVDGSTLRDSGFNQNTYDGVKLYAAANEKSYKYYLPPNGDWATDDDRLEAMLQACQNGAEVVVVEGFMQEMALRTAAQEYPNIHFIFVDGWPLGLANVAPIAFKEEQAGFLAGYAAVMEGYTQLGFVGAGDGYNPAIQRYGYGFFQGADAAAAELGVSVNMKYSWAYGSTYSASPELKAMATGWYAGGTEVILVCGGSMFQSVAAAAYAEDGKVVGVDVDQSYESPNVLTSAMKGLTEATQWALAKHYDGRWSEIGDHYLSLGAAENAVALPTDTWSMSRWRVSDYEKLLADMAAGRVTVSADLVSIPAATANVTVEYIE